MRSILVTGGSGFLGSHLCERLLERGDNVVCLDNFFTGRKENILHLMGNPRFELIRHDIVEPITLEVDQIYNLACPASPVAYQYNPIKTIKTSTVGVVNVLGLAKRCKARVLHASTSEVYGDPTVHPQTEDYWGNVNPIGPRSCYDEGKRVAESLCYCDDLIRGMMLMMEQDQSIGPVNIGNPGEYTMLQLAQEVLRAIPESKSTIEHVPLPQDDPKQRCPDITKAQTILGWSPEIDLQTGLARTVEYYRAELARA